MTQFDVSVDFLQVKPARKEMSDLSMAIPCTKVVWSSAIIINGAQFVMMRLVEQTVLCFVDSLVLVIQVRLPLRFAVNIIAIC